MIATGVRDTDLGAYQRAVRTLLVHPLVTATSPDADALALVRRFASDLTRDLADVAGYRLDVGATSARLVKRLDRLDPTQVVRSRGQARRPFDRRRYAYLCLVLGALGRAGAQVALTELADALRRRAAEVEGLGFDPDEYRHRLAFVDVLGHLESVGALRPVEVSTVAWLTDPEAGEALFDVDREVVHQVFVPPRVLQHVASTRALLTDDLAVSRDTQRAASRQRLARLLLEYPVLHLDDLEPIDRAYLLNQARSLADDLHRLTGGQLERRAEGVALLDATGGFSDRRFPTGGTPAQAALLLADRLSALSADPARADRTAAVPAIGRSVEALIARLDACRPAPAVVLEPDEIPITLGPPPAGPADDPPAGVLADDAWLRAEAERLATTYGRAFAADLRDDTAGLLAAALEVLSAFDLVRRVPGGVVAMAPIARYRDVLVEEAPSAQLAFADLSAVPARELEDGP